MTILYAQPYNIDAVGFYFQSVDQFEQKAEDLTDRYGSPVEEFEIQFIEGEPNQAQLFNVCGINQSNLDLWFESLEILDDRQKVALYYLVAHAGYCLEQVMDKLEEVTIYECGLREAAEEIFDDCHLASIPAACRPYVDYEKFARDLQSGGELCEFQFGSEIYTVNAGAL